jgi:SNARE protein
VQTAAVLSDQTKQLNKIVDDLADIEFNVKKATKVIRDITRGLLTDKCVATQTAWPRCHACV